MAKRKDISIEFPSMVVSQKHQVSLSLQLWKKKEAPQWSLDPSLNTQIGNRAVLHTQLQKRRTGDGIVADLQIDTVSVRLE